MAFSGTNVRIARVFRGLTQDQLADRVSASPATIWQIEKGRLPNDSLLAAMGLVMGFEPEYFFDPVEEEEFTVDDCNFRSRLSTAERARKKILARGTLFARLIRYLQTEVVFKEYSVPQIPVETPSDIENTAEKVREEWGLGTTAPILNMSRVLENHGVMLTKLDGESKKLDAFSARPRRGGLGFVVLSDAKGSTSRARYDMAHELAHLVFGHHALSGTLADREKQADRFASAFLLPRKAFTSEFWAGGTVDWDRMPALKVRWKVSMQAMVYRAYDLDLINAIEFRRAYKTMSAKGWRKGEPHEPPAEEPEMFASAMRLMKERRNKDAAAIAKELHWTLDTLQAVSGWKEPTEAEKPTGLSLLNGGEGRAAQSPRRAAGKR